MVKAVVVHKHSKYATKGLIKVAIIRMYGSYIYVLAYFFMLKGVENKEGIRDLWTNCNTQYIECNVNISSEQSLQYSSLYN